MLERFETEEYNFCFSIVFPPILCNLLSSDSLQEDYLKWLENKILLGQKELIRNKAMCSVKLINGYSPIQGLIISMATDSIQVMEQDEQFPVTIMKSAIVYILRLS